MGAEASLVPGQLNSQQSEINPQIEKLNYSTILASADLDTALPQDVLRSDYELSYAGQLWILQNANYKLKQKFWARQSKVGPIKK